jgi:uncharacterized surface protein with fasciclin (FAS1) repeats
MKQAVRTSLVASAAASLVIGATALPASAAKPDWANKSDATIVETAVALSGTPGEFDTNGGDFDILVSAVLATQYNTSTLNGMDDYTVFAPTDAAFVALADALDNGMSDGSISTEADAFDAVVSLGVPTVEAVLDYHVTDGVRNSKSVTNAKKITMLDGNTISARGGSVDAIGSDAGFVATDIRVADGMIHVVDTVLLPF